MVGIRIWLCLSIGLLWGCSNTTEQLVRDGDWYQVGYRDGISGKLSRPWGELQQLGAVRQSDYDEGYLEGLDEYCNPDFAYQIGLSGQEYFGACAGTPQGQRFRLEWQRGHQDFRMTY
ncbi:DUF2799 domain-containing protein [Vibrio sp. SM6]|uniref:DUF2799 domain-containing protein n=1 Tax=Vibrio agarilyticus TaxID=2726741 RepID=A0A7X8TNY3_9VIBR|nr:DUF2799 domain-containing protein [Vibrio agarilyticus]NLS12231.1 DUF2799 domain-containing protein [Vibrio agarilyticus]